MSKPLVPEDENAGKSRRRTRERTGRNPDRRGRRSVSTAGGDLVETAIALMFPDPGSDRSGMEAMAPRLSELARDPAIGGSQARAIRKAARSPTGKLARHRFKHRDFAALLSARWGPQFMVARATVARVNLLPPALLIDARIHDWLLDHVAPPSGTVREEWLRKQSAALLCDAYVQDLVTFANLREENLDQKRAIEAALLSLVDSESLDAFRRLGAHQDSTLLVGLHAGAYTMSKYLVETQFKNLVRIGSNSSENVANVKHDPIRALMELVRFLRRPGNLAAIRADGNFKGTTADVEVLGVTFNFGLGAPHAVFHSGCRNFFSLAAWRGDQIALDLVEGPRKQAGEPIDAFTARWFAAWGGYIERLLLGDPRNIRGVGGMWPALGGMRRQKGPRA